MRDPVAIHERSVDDSRRGRPQVRAYRFALDPTPLQEEQLRSHCGAQRFAYNWGLRLVKANLEQRAAERTYGIGETDLTPALNWSAYAMRKSWNRLKSELAPWWAENSKEAYSSGLANLAAALNNWAASQSGTRNGRPMRFPRFKTRKSHMSCRFTTGAFGLTDRDRRHVKLPRIGLVRTHESTRKLARRIACGSSRIRSATISFSRGRWFVSFSVDFSDLRAPLPDSPAVVGVDLGIHNLAVLSAPVPGISDADGVVANPRQYELALKKLRRLQRMAARRTGPDRRSGRTPSRRWIRAKARVDRLHTRIANRRTETLHQLTSALAERFGVVVVEDLYIAGMLCNRRLARQIAAASWGELRRQLTYKTDWRGGCLQVANRFYPSSKTCSGCGAVKTNLRLSERIFLCDVCGMSMDRDRNAARNLAALADQIAGGTSSPSCGATQNEPAGNPLKNGHYGHGYGHGKSLEDNVA
ncbi:IS607 family element RNA-guided endonuclease TnpB [Mycolicibacterium celeriflavum]|uniref:IS607 family element RNA-guided endonuclease TnpB n=1 Tax=Mycolicibacterium celeriflavum TaxID=1249101 RepID=UPI0010423791|nr:IS607 family element RNA-guided endonuclease TnpB [Mycolicibacterium celeriflavum]